MKKTLILAGFSALMMTSCVSKKKYDELQSEFEKVFAAQQTCNNQLTRCESDRSSIQAQLDASKANLNSLQSALDQCLNAQSTGNVNITKLIEQIDASNSYIKQLIASKSKSDSLNMVLTNNLTRSLSRDEMRDIDVQVQKGVVFISLSDNMLYRSGSYEISSEANEVLGKIAKIIKDYPTYDVMVEGNTDNVPISKTNIRNNWDLSALRASSVVQALQEQHGVDPKRMTAGGRGEYNSISSNDTPSGRAENRRTEIIILPNLEQFMELIGQAPRG
ncbi:Inner membrane lipoprotein YiaD precursor [Candidatus Ornithobacterium hominis]|uniref:Inner membrane lipoprotein YiaD n=1 Tax=Candidatus Ornithobacterium hominis TaxID=2497989 RepID=A0A383U002_9FLAO|nr:flagellar motor protein MotB [Candidatus Ornithobacterium hominis]MCT7904274.1 flagellar motor protein MotB [Candidatus Ornithobacterium hominis]CAI9429509.1 Inner membrane lipoprotein YiaD [Candidatus Ornithobacterium hominis]SZD72937.1 Inner membrane lipoprotein YiaD precursor [Candidatus Ornithobacterium hominis]SZD73144.1 Inner membrane lipoprotein YiaD precursor [Candidatus Ornithobacterium hominis]